MWTAAKYAWEELDETAGVSWCENTLSFLTYCELNNDCPIPC